MNIKELNKLIKEELDAFLNEDQTNEMYMEDGDDIEVTTDEPAEEEDPLALLRQIYDMLKPIVDDEGEEEVDDIEDDVEGEVEDLEGEDEAEEAEEDEAEEMEEVVGYPTYRADQVSKVKADATDVNQGLNESFDGADRFQKLANIIK